MDILGIFRFLATFRPAQFSGQHKRSHKLRETKKFLNQYMLLGNQTSSWGNLRSCIFSSSRFVGRFWSFKKTSRGVLKDSREIFEKFLIILGGLSKTCTIQWSIWETKWDHLENRLPKEIVDQKFCIRSTELTDLQCKWTETLHLFKIVRKF